VALKFNPETAFVQAQHVQTWLAPQSVRRIAEDRALRQDFPTVNYNCSNIPAATPDVYITKIFSRANDRIRQDVFRQILAAAERQGIAPNTDVFSSKAHRRLPDYWSAHSDAFKKFWNTKILWINPPVKHLERIVEKVYRDETKGIILVPRWPDCAWFVSLCYIAVDWWDYPPATALFEDGRGRTLSAGLFPILSRHYF